MNTRHRVGLAVVSCLVLGACDDAAKLWKRSDIVAIVEDYSQNNADVIDHNARASEDLTERLRELETQVAALRATMQDSNRAYDAHLRISGQLADRSDANDRRFTEAVNMLGRYHGIGPIQYIPQAAE